MISVVIPALNEERTVAQVVNTVKGSADEVLVIDADSTDNTAAEARRAGAQVINWREPVGLPPRPGKGESLWRGVAAAKGEIVCFIDADLTEVSPSIVDELVAGFHSEDVLMVKANYQRVSGGVAEGGRVTELTAKPLLRKLFPQLDHIHQPLGGEYALRRSAATAVPFVGGYGVEAGLLIDIAALGGSTAVREVHTGRRAHRNRPLRELAPMADEVATTILYRAGVLPRGLIERPPLQHVLGTSASEGESLLG